MRSQFNIEVLNHESKIINMQKTESNLQNISKYYPNNSNFWSYQIPNKAIYMKNGKYSWNKESNQLSEAQFINIDNLSDSNNSLNDKI